jgi:hypothetical protein
MALGMGCGGLEVSLDLGRHWRHLWAAPGNASVVAFAALPADDSRIRTGLITTVSEGGSGALVLLKIAPSGEVRSETHLLGFWGTGVPAVGGDFVAVGTARGIEVSRDGGVSWDRHRRGLEEVTISVDPVVDVIPDDERRQGYGIFALAVDPIRPGALFAGTVDGLFTSTDFGETWQRIEGVDGRVTAVALLTGDGPLLGQRSGVVIVVPVTR